MRAANATTATAGDARASVVASEPAMSAVVTRRLRPMGTRGKSRFAKLETIDAVIQKLIGVNAIDGAGFVNPSPTDLESRPVHGKKR
jgi:hypothetical protein